MKKTETKDYISNKELAKAFETRENNSCGELTYFNTGCWSYAKARYEIDTVSSPLFLNIPSLNLSDTFADEEENALRILLDSYRNGLSFSDFREELKKNPGYKSKKRNLYIFPDWDHYHDAIFSGNDVPIIIDVRLRRWDGNAWEDLNSANALDSRPGE